jgi:hypothetical protein
MPAESFPRIIDNRPARRPGGARGAPFPELPEGAAVIVWLLSGDCLNLVMGVDGPPSAADGLTVPWELVDWWIPA